MRLYFCFYIVFTQIITLSAMRNAISAVKDPIKETDAVFASVIHNITHINNVLQDLIYNYKHLQKIYKSQEFTTDDETDEGFKDSKRSKYDNTPVTPKNYGVTQIIWEDITGYKNESEIYEKTDSEKVSGHNSDLKEVDEEQKQSDTFFGDTHTHKKEKDDTGENILSAKILHGSKIHKTRYIKVSNEHEDTSHDKNIEKTIQKQNSMSSESDDLGSGQNQRNDKLNKNSLRSKKPVIQKLHSETFSAKKIWDEIINNKPIKLEAHYEKSQTEIRKNRDKHSDDRSGKPLTKHNLKEEILDSENESTQPDISTSNDELRASVLRHAYGDACLKLVVRKCYKALRAVSKEMCTRFRCKSDYKEKFLDFSKKGCIREFMGNDTKDADDNYFYRENKAMRLEVNVSGRYSDFTRGGYVHACLPHLETKFKGKEKTKSKNKQPKGKNHKGKAIRTSSNDTNLTNADTSDFNTLRDRFEKACKKTSTKKCTTACNYASKQICESFTCSKNKRRSYKKTCKRQCKTAYRSYEGSGSNSDSSSYSSSSESYDDSDSDSSS